MSNVNCFVKQMPHTPLTPGSTHGPNGGPPSVPPVSSNSTTITSSADSIKNSTGAPVHDATTSVDLPSDLNFDPAAVIDGEAQGQEGLNVSISDTGIGDIVLNFCVSVCLYVNAESGYAKYPTITGIFLYFDIQCACMLKEVRYHETCCQPVS